MLTERRIFLQAPEGVCCEGQVTGALCTQPFQLADGLLIVDRFVPENRQEVPAVSLAVIERRGIPIIGNEQQRLGRGEAVECYAGLPPRQTHGLDRKSTRLNSSHLGISYAVFCLK